MKNTKRTTKAKDRGSLTLNEILDDDNHLNYLPGDQLPNLTIPARDWLTKFVAGERTPYADSIRPDDYEIIEMVVSVLTDPWSGSDESELLPKSAVDYVEEWLYRMEEAADLHVWDVPDIARPFLAHAYELARTSDSTEGGKEALETALSQLCTQDELTRFYERHNLNRKTERTAYKGSQAGRDRQVAIKAARVIADPSVPDEFKDLILDVINDLGMATTVSCLHPALIERALTLMFESKDYGHGKADAQNGRKKLRKLIAAIPVSEQTHQPANLKEAKKQ
jgi:hypothetical protein